MSDHNIYVNDLLTRKSGYSFAESTIGSIITVTFTDGSSVTQAKATGLTLIDAYRKIRLDVLDGESPPFVSTTTQRDALTSVDTGTLIYNLITGRFEAYTGSAWVNSSGSGTMDPIAFGEMVEDNSSGSSINTTTKLWSTASVGLLDSNGIITFSDNSTGDKLVVGTGGAGTYQINFSCTFTNAGGNIVSGGIHNNGAEVGKLEDSHSGDSSEKRDLRGQGFLTLAAGDEITMHVVSETASDVVTVYHSHVTISRMT